MKNNNLNYLFGISVLFLLSILGQSCNNQKNSKEAKEQAEKPNIVFIMADDLGIGDVSCYGATMIETPNIDKLGSEGIQVSNYYFSNT